MALILILTREVEQLDFMIVEVTNFITKIIRREEEAEVVVIINMTRTTITVALHIIPIHLSPLDKKNIMDNLR